MKYATVEQVTKSHHTPIGIALNTTAAGETVRIVVQSGYRATTPRFEAAEDIPVGALVMFTQSRWERAKDWLIRKLGGNR